MVTRSQSSILGQEPCGTQNHNGDSQPCGTGGACRGGGCGAPR